MFTGLIQEIGATLGAERRGGFLRLRVGYDPGRGALRPGDSMAVNGVCLTAAALAEALRLHDVRWTPAGEDIMVEAYVRGPACSPA